MTEQKKQRSPIETGAPDGFQYMHPTMRKNFGQWKWHDHPKPGVLRHKAESGDEIWTVRAGTQRILDVFTLRTLCDIGDKYADGFVRFTIRSNIEYMVKDSEKVEPLIEASINGSTFSESLTMYSMLLLIVNLTNPSAYLSPISQSVLRVNTSKIL